MAERAYEESAEAFRLLDNEAGEAGVAMTAVNLGELARDRGDLARARALNEEAFAIHSRTAPASVALMNLAQLDLEEGDVPAARSRWRQALEGGREAGYRGVGTAAALDGFAQTLLAERSVGVATSLLAAVEAMLAEMGGRFDGREAAAHERAVTVARTMLPGESFEQAWSAGAEMELDAAIDYALSH